MHTRSLAALLFAPALVAVGVLVPALPAAAAPSDIVINEIESNGDATDWVEFINTGTEPVDVTGWVLRDENDDEPFTFPAATIAPGAYFVADLQPEHFGLGNPDTVRLFLADGITPVASHTYPAHATITWGRCPDGVGELAQTVKSTKGAANVCELDPAEVVRINEVESSGGAPSDWIELKNTGAFPVDISGLVLKDNGDADPFTVPDGTEIAAGGYYVADVDGPYFGLGGGDSARLFAADGTTIIDQTTWTAHALDTSYGRCPDGIGEFATTASVTKGSANDCVVGAIPPVIINEVESSGGTPGDWAELLNTGATEADISGWWFKDSEDDHRVQFPAGTTIPAGGFYVIEEGFFGNGLGGADSARLFLPDEATLVDSRSWTAHATTTYGVCGSAFETTTSSTKGAPNDCSPPIRINEVESDAGTPGDWIELKNNGAGAVDVSGWVLRDSTENDPYTFPAGTSIAGGGYLTVDVGGAIFGLGGGDSARLFDGAVLVDSHSWTAHATTTYGRCPDGTGAFATTTAPTKNSVNACPGDLQTSPWPGAAEVTLADDAVTFGGDLSGLVFDGSAVWAVSNGDGLLYKLIRDGETWIPVPAWQDGVVLHYADGAGTVDSEGVTVTGAGSDGGVYVASERNNDASGVSRLAVLRYDVSEPAAALTAVDEWDLTGLLPAVGANLGLEGIAWVPDSYLVGSGFVDPATSAAYDPADYPGHGDGLFFVGVEATGNVHAFALGADADLIATFDSGFEIVADLGFDAERGGLWVACDDTCQGRTAIFDVSASGAFEPVTYFERPAQMPNLNNEGFAIAPQGLCDDGSKVVLWADDGDTGGHALRMGSIDCTEGGAPIPFPADGLLELNRNDVTAPKSAAAGSTITVGVGDGNDGDAVDAWIYSVPVHLGEKTVSAAGSFQVTIPSTTTVGAHRIAVTAADGQLIGWADITITAAPGLANTGSESLAGGAVAAGLLLLGGLGLVVLRRRRTA